MKQISTLCLGLALGASSLLLSSCEKWLDVTPPSEMRAEEHYSTVLGFQQTLTGCYISMTNDNAYGKNLTWYAVELMGHQLQNAQDKRSRDLFDHAYDTTEALSVSKGIWNALYNVAANADDALANLEEHKGELNELEYNLIRGELLAIRAYVHFDLLRLFGYGNYAGDAARLSSKLTVPYLTVVDKNQPRQITMADFYTRLTEDLSEAERLLKASDPLVSGLDEKAYEGVNADGFYNKRDLHLNYYAVKGLQARVNLWFGTPDNLPKALEAAKEVIAFFKDGGFDSLTFGTTMQEVKAAGVDASTASLATEALFEIELANLGDKLSPYFVLAFSGTHPTALTTPADRIETLFEGSTSDVRLLKTLLKNPAAFAYTSLKYNQEGLGDDFKNRLNMMRLSEIYLIAAEAATLLGQNAEAIDYLVTLRENRGDYGTVKEDLMEKEPLLEAIRTEYEKEFISEGVTFYQYKRWNTALLPLSKEEETMSPKAYMLPFPQDELQNGYVQDFL